MCIYFIVKSTIYVAFLYYIYIYITFLYNVLGMFRYKNYKYIRHIIYNIIERVTASDHESSLQLAYLYRVF